ncbi:hypothetical protein VYU27_010005, partial [Nannochloropsis oceanica]
MRANSEREVVLRPTLLNAPPPSLLHSLAVREPLAFQWTLYPLHPPLSYYNQRDGDEEGGDGAGGERGKEGAWMALRRARRLRARKRVQLEEERKVKNEGGKEEKEVGRGGGKRGSISCEESEGRSSPPLPWFEMGGCGGGGGEGGSREEGEGTKKYSEKELENGGKGGGGGGGGGEVGGVEDEQQSYHPYFQPSHFQKQQQQQQQQQQYRAMSRDMYRLGAGGGTNGRREGEGGRGGGGGEFSLEAMMRGGGGMDGGIGGGGPSLSRPSSSSSSSSRGGGGKEGGRKRKGGKENDGLPRPPASHPASSTSRPEKEKQQQQQQPPKKSKATTAAEEEIIASGKKRGGEEGGKEGGREGEVTLMNLPLEAFDRLETASVMLGKEKNDLKDFLMRCEEAGEVSMALLYHDLSSSYATLTRRFCTPKSPCLRWNCACDKHVRAEQAVAPVVAALFLLPSLPGQEGGTGGGREGGRAFFLPLAPSSRQKKHKTASTSSSSSSFLPPSSSPSSYSLPLRELGTTVYDRWICLAMLLQQPQTTKIFFSAQVNLFPFFGFLLRQQQCHPSFLRSLVDVKVAGWVLQEQLKENDLEYLPLLARVFPSGGLPPPPVLQAGEMG